MMKKSNNCFIVSMRLIEIIFHYTTEYCKISINAITTINSTVVELKNACVLKDFTCVWEPVSENYQTSSYDS